MNEQNKQELVKSIEKRYGKRKNFDLLSTRAHREIFKEDIIQPGQRDFKHIYKKAAQRIERENMEKDKKAVLNYEEVAEVYRENAKHILTTEQKTLKDLQSEHPTLVSEEDIIKWPTK